MLKRGRTYVSNENVVCETGMLLSDKYTSIFIYLFLDSVILGVEVDLVSWKLKSAQRGCLSGV